MKLQGHLLLYHQRLVYRHFRCLYLLSRKYFHAPVSSDKYNCRCDLCINRIYTVSHCTIRWFLHGESVEWKPEYLQYLQFTVSIFRMNTSSAFLNGKYDRINWLLKGPFVGTIYYKLPFFYLIFFVDIYRFSRKLVYANCTPRNSDKSKFRFIFKSKEYNYCWNYSLR